VASGKDSAEDRLARRLALTPEEDRRLRVNRFRLIAAILIAVVVVATVATALALRTDRGTTSVDNPGTIDAVRCTTAADLQGIARKYDPTAYRQISLTKGRTYGFIMRTNCGNIEVTLDSDTAPRISQNLIFLANTGAPVLKDPTNKSGGTIDQTGYFDNSSCWRLTSYTLSVLQCGDPLGDGTGNPGYFLKDEALPRSFSKAKGKPGRVIYPRGTVAMANAGPNTNGSQFFIVYQDSALPPNYPVIGVVSKGLEIVDKVARDGINPTDATGTDGSPKQALVARKIDSFELLTAR
jgi:peptidyl-prolyl cis-trans isomerase B (cyclophilin B)